MEETCRKPINNSPQNRGFVHKSYLPSNPVMDYSLNTQRDILALMFSDTETGHSQIYVSSCLPESFNGFILKDIAGHLFRFYEKYQEMPSKNALYELVHSTFDNYSANRKKEFTWEQYEESLNYITSSQFSPGEIEYLRKVISSFGKFQAVSKAMIAIAQVLDETYSKHKLETNYLETVEKIWEQAKIVGVLETTKYSSDSGIDDDSAVELFEEHGEEVREVIPTGSKILDGDGVTKGLLDGGVRRGEMFLIVAPTAYGKTSGLISHGVAAMKAGKNVYHVTLENAPDQIKRWYYQNMTGMTKEELIKLPKEKRRKIILSANEKYYPAENKLHIAHWPIRGVNTKGIIADIRMLESRSNFKPDVVIIDYGALLKPNYNYNDKYLSLTEIYEDMRGMCSELGVVLYSVVQTNREGYNHAQSSGRVDLSHIAGAYNITTVADYILIYNHDEANNKKLYGYLAKNRDGKAEVFISGTDMDINLSTRRVYFTTEYTPKDLPKEQPTYKRTSHKDWEKENKSNIVDNLDEEKFKKKLEEKEQKQRNQRANEYLKSYMPPDFLNGDSSEYLDYVQKVGLARAEREKLEATQKYLRGHPDELKKVNAKIKAIREGKE